MANDKPTGVAVARMAKGKGPGPEHKRLEKFIGRWMTVGETVEGPGGPSLPILASDIYEWVPGGFFIQHFVHSRIGELRVGGIEIIGYDASSMSFRTHFFDSQGVMITESLSVDDEGVWHWQGTHHRCTGTFTNDGDTLTAKHERSDDGVAWEPSMTVVIRKIC